MKKNLIKFATLILTITMIKASAFAQEASTSAPQSAAQKPHAITQRESLREEISNEIKSFREKMKAIYNEYKQKKEALKNSLSPEAKKFMEEKRERKSKTEGREDDKRLMESKS